MTDSKHAHAPQFDTGPLSWVLGEIRDALERSSKALQDAAGRSLEAQPTLLLHAKSHLHQAHGALQMVDVLGAEHLTGAAEKAIDRFKDGSLVLDGARVAVVGEAYRALVEYLEELLEGGAAPRPGAGRQQPVRLFPYYRALQELLGAERVHPGDMLALDLAPALLPGGAAGPAPDYAASRAQFEKALLFFLRSTDPDTQRNQAGAMRDALAPVTRVQADPQAHAFWLALQTVADLVAQGQVGTDLYVKQLFGQVNLQLRRMAQGHSSLPEALLRDALFFVALAPAPTPDARLLRDAWRLDGQVPRDYLERRYGRMRKRRCSRPSRAWTASPAAQASSPPPSRNPVSMPPWPSWPAPATSWARPRWPSCCANWARPPVRRWPAHPASSCKWRWRKPCCWSSTASTRCASCPRISASMPKRSASACWPWLTAKRRRRRRNGRASWRVNCSRAKPKWRWRARCVPACARSRS
jgi:hypothetical protein